MNPSEAEFRDINDHTQRDGDRRRFLEFTLATAASLWLSPSAFALSMGDLSEKDADSGIKAALERGATIAVALLGKQDGFWANDQVRIPLPDWIKKFERAIKLLGKSKDIEAMKIGVNRAAEQAVPQAKALLVAAVKGMSVQDARKILTGGDNSVTRFFQDKTEVALGQKFLPVDKVACARGRRLCIRWWTRESRPHASSRPLLRSARMGRTQRWKRRASSSCR